MIFFCAAKLRRRLMLACEYLEFGFLGKKRWTVRSSSKVLKMLSIQPKHRASSTASLYLMRGLPVPFL
jgi:hypothetical protein